MFGFTNIDKMLASFVTPALVSAIGGWAAGFGITGKMDTTTFITMLVTAAFTYLIPGGFGKTIASFVTPALVSGIMGVVTGIGITGAMDWKTALTMGFTGLITHITRNRDQAQHPTLSNPPKPSW